ncbi:MAG TPA: sialidase family protein [Dokdonella sp.]|uniref:sialidase family protein n=1 Tax=Dokdonella sp. TaxID=2291710 RepID=UPI002D7F2DB3|nr:sialidase family protein [Dokdonella sp.]HET9031359.1 sialidase family protein [Dokdonella sp.]
MTKSIRRGIQGALVVLLLSLAGCGGGSSNSSSPAPTPPPPTPPPPPPTPTLDPEYRVTASSPFASNCEGVAISGTVAVNSEVEPHFALDPGNPQRYFGAWQQDRRTSGGARALGVGVSNDGGQTWSRSFPAFSRCAGGDADNGGDYERTSDPWVAVSPDGTAYVISISFNGAALMPGSDTSVLVSRSIDGGETWGPPTTLVLEGDVAFHDKQTITADPLDSRFIYAVWDRIAIDNTGPTWFTRSIDGGESWEPARPIYDPGVNSQTIGNIIVVLPNGTLVNFYTHIDVAANGATSAWLDLIRSTDNGVSWSSPIRIASELTVGTVDPETGARVRDGTLVPTVAVAADGKLYAAWQDSRFSNGNHDSIAVAHSSDGGLTWSDPLRANGDPTVAAFLPALNVRADGMIGLSYFDLRSNTSDANTLYTDIWLARSTDAVNWQESQVSGPFDLSRAPQAAWGNGLAYFLGDYQGLGSSGSTFIPFYARTTGEGNGNRTDVFAAPAVSVTTSYATMASELRAKGPATAIESQPLVINPEFRRRVSENIQAKMEIRMPGRPRDEAGQD